MKNIGSRLTKVEEYLNKINEADTLDPSNWWKKVTPDDLKMTENMVATFRKLFPLRASKLGLDDVPENADHKKKCMVIFKNSADVLAQIIIDLHREDLINEVRSKDPDVRDPRNEYFLKKVRSRNEFAYALRLAEETLSKGNDN